MIHLIPKASAAAMADLCTPLIDKALVKSQIEDRYPLEWVLREIRKGTMHLWVAWRGMKITGILVTRAEPYPSGKTWLNLFAVSGWRMSQWGPKMWEQVVKFCRIANIDYIVGGGRAGWKRIIDKYAPQGETLVESNITVQVG